MTHSDTGTVLAPDQAALVVDKDGELSLLFPDYGEDGEVPAMVVLLAAVAQKANDPEWVEAMIGEFMGGAN